MNSKTVLVAALLVLAGVAFYTEAAPNHYSGRFMSSLCRFYHRLVNVPCPFLFARTILSSEIDTVWSYGTKFYYTHPTLWDLSNPPTGQDNIYGAVVATFDETYAGAWGNHYNPGHYSRAVSEEEEEDAFTKRAEKVSRDFENNAVWIEMQKAAAEVATLKLPKSYDHVKNYYDSLSRATSPEDLDHIVAPQNHPAPANKKFSADELRLFDLEQEVKLYAQMATISDFDPARVNRAFDVVRSVVEDNGAPKKVSSNESADAPVEDAHSHRPELPANAISARPSVE